MSFKKNYKTQVKYFEAFWENMYDMKGIFKNPRELEVGRNCINWSQRVHQRVAKVTVSETKDPARFIAV